MGSLRVPNEQHEDAKCYECDRPIKGTDWCAEVGYGSGRYRAEHPVCIECWQKTQVLTATINLDLLRRLNHARAAGVAFDDIHDAATLSMTWMVVESERVWPNAALCVIFDRYGAP